MVDGVIEDENVDASLARQRGADRADDGCSEPCCKPVPIDKRQKISWQRDNTTLKVNLHEKSATHNFSYLFIPSTSSLTSDDSRTITSYTSR